MKNKTNITISRDDLKRQIEIEDGHAMMRTAQAMLLYTRLEQQGYEPEDIGFIADTLKLIAEDSNRSWQMACSREVRI